MQNKLQTERAIFETARKPEPADFAGIATDFFKRFNNKRLHIFGSGWGSQAHLHSLTKALFEASLRPTFSVLELTTPKFDEITNYRKITTPINEIKKSVPKNVEVLVPWDDWSNTGFSSGSTLIGILYLKDELGFKEIYAGNTLDFCGWGNYYLIWDYPKFYGPRQFLKNKFPYIPNEGLTLDKQKKQEKIREKTIKDLESRGYLDLISNYRYPYGIRLSELGDYNEKTGLIERLKNYLFKKEAMKTLKQHLNSGE